MSVPQVKINSMMTLTIEDAAVVFSIESETFSSSASPTSESFHSSGPDEVSNS